MKRVAKYLVSHNRVVFQYFWQDEGPPMMLFADSDWAGCRKTRKSTSGGAIMIGGHCIKVWSHTQGPIALSSAEAEYYAIASERLAGDGQGNRPDRDGPADYPQH